nr:transposase [Streptomyces misionensis]
MNRQLGELGLVLNAIGLWTTTYIDAAIAQLRAGCNEPGTRTSPACPRSSTAT